MKSAVTWPVFCLGTMLGILLPSGGPNPDSGARGGEVPTAAARSRAAGSTRSGSAVSNSGNEQVAVINDAIRQLWDEYGIRPSPEAADGPWCRRLYLDLLGRIPTIDELNRFCSDRSRDKEAELVDQLLGEHYVNAYARHWTTIWTNLLIGRNGGNERNSLTDRQGLQAYLRDSFAHNKPYDRMVYELVTATGANDPEQSEFNGAVNFLIGKLDQSAVRATAETAKVFLGLQVQCTQCHNHPFNDWKQNQFWEFNAFFRQTVALRRFKPGTREIRFVELANQDFAGEGSEATPDEAEIYYELRNGILKAAYPVFVDGKARPRLSSGYLSDVDRRNELGKLIVQSEYLPEAIVNRMWAHFFGYGFTQPVDDMGPHNPPSHPQLLKYLAQQFREHDCDLKQLIRWIVLSEPYRLSSRIVASNESDDPALGESPKFSHFYLRQLRAEELYESLLVATDAHMTRGDAQQQEETRRRWLRQFVIAFGTDEGDETTTFNGSIPQTLMMFNGDLMKEATGATQGSFLWRIAASGLRPAQKIEQLYLAALARKPSRREIQAANYLWAAHHGDTTAALQDMWWALLNSNEFILTH